MGEVVIYRDLRALRAKRLLRREQNVSVMASWHPRREQRGTAHPLFRGALASRVVARFGNWDEV